MLATEPAGRDCVLVFGHCFSFFLLRIVRVLPTSLEPISLGRDDNTKARSQRIGYNPFLAMSCLQRTLQEDAVFNRVVALAEDERGSL